MRTVFQDGPYRGWFGSNEERRMHIHVQRDRQVCKIWLEPYVEYAKEGNFSNTELRKILEVVKKS